MLARQLLHYIGVHHVFMYHLDYPIVSAVRHGSRDGNPWYSILGGGEVCRYGVGGMLGWICECYIG